MELMFTKMLSVHPHGNINICSKSQGDAFDSSTDTLLYRAQRHIKIAYCSK